MSDSKPTPLVQSRSQVPAASPPSTPSLPALPQGNAIFGSLRRRLEKDTRTVSASATYLRARADQAQACAELIAKREGLALALARLSSIGELIQHDYERGRLTRLNELRRMQLEHEMSEVTLQIQVAAARQQLAQYQPHTAPPASTSANLQPADVEAVLQQFPDIKPEQIGPIVAMLRGLAAEKRS